MLTLPQEHYRCSVSSWKIHHSAYSHDFGFPNNIIDLANNIIDLADNIIDLADNINNSPDNSSYNYSSSPADCN